MTAPKAPDRRVQRTHRVLREALIELILQRGWDEISVQHVCDRADVGRSTFYTHFADKEDLLVSGFGELHKALRSQPAADGAAGPGRFAFLRGLLDHVHDNRRLFRAMVGKRSGHVVQQRFRQLLIDLIQEELTSLVPPSPHREATVRYLAGAHFELLSWWLDTKNPLQTEDVEALFHQLTEAAVAGIAASL